jgi:O-antigen/teichoic acid export membrane protein
MSIRRNIVANYVGQLYAALIGILLVPLYVGYMGVEAYGLVGFYTMLQGWFMLLDMGLTPTLGREAARFNGGAISALDLRRLLRAFEGVFVALGAAGALTLIAGAGLVTDHWLKLQQLDAAEVQRALMLMAVIVALRWVGGLYRGAIAGFERIVWLSGSNVAFATLRFVLVIPFLIYVGATPTHFFSYQLVVAALEAAVLIGKTYHLLPPVVTARWIRWEWQPLRGVLRFALSAAVTSVIWVLVTQTDKLVLSGIVPLTDYAYFTLAVLAASGITLLSSPVAGAILPRLTRLNAEGDEVGLVRMYRGATQLVAVIVVPIVLVLACFPAQVIVAWTGQPELAANAAPVLALYALGNGILALAAFPYYLQVARGELTLHLIGNLIFVALFVPLLLLAVNRFGMIGAGYAWIVANLLPFLVWLPIVHRRHLAGLHVDWLTKDIGSIVVLPAIAAVLVMQLVAWPASRGGLIIALLTVYLVLAALAAGSSSAVRGRLRARPQRSLA